MTRCNDACPGIQVTFWRTALRSGLMRMLLALLAVVGLLASPLTAAAAQAVCEGHGETMMSMAMTDMAHADGEADPCCDPAKDQGPSKQDPMSCLQACIVMCGVVAALPEAPAVDLAGPKHDAPPPSRVASLKAHEPGRLERPPRSIA